MVARAGSVIDLPYDDNVFDLVWCANVSQYLNDDDLTSMLQEMHRVTRPGGFVALKEVDATKTHFFGPLDPALNWHFLEAARHIQQFAGVLRTTYLPRWFRNTGFDSINYRSFFAERRQPLEPAAIEFLQDIGAFRGNRAVELGLPEDELVHWRRLIDPEAPNYILKDPDLDYCEVSAVVMGQVPRTVSV